MTVLPQGGYLAVDTGGFIVPDVSFAKIQPPWRGLVDDVIAAVAAHPQWQVSSLYLRGSVPRGLAVAGLSDLDLILISSHIPDTADVTRALLEKHSFCRGIEWGFCDEASLEKTHPPHDLPHMKVVLKTQGLHLSGADLLAGFPPVRCDINMVTHAFGLHGDWQEYKTGGACHVWICKRILRAAFEIAALGKGVFTRDLYFCCKTATEAFPQLGGSLQKLLGYALAERIDVADVATTGQPVVDFLCAQPLLAPKEAA